jgi:hypothetical protein
MAGLGCPPAEIAARAGHSVHILLATYTHCLPGYGQIASQHIDRALHASTGPPLAHKSGHHPARPVRHASVPQLDPMRRGRT